MRRFWACFLVIIAIILVTFGISRAIDIPLQWDVVPGITQYEVEMSVDQGANWSLPRSTTHTDPNSNDVNFTWVGAPDNGLLLFRATSVRSGVKATSTKAGAWYNGDWIPPDFPIGLGVNN